MVCGQLRAVKPFSKGDQLWFNKRKKKGTQYIKFLLTCQLLLHSAFAFGSTVFP